MSSGSFGFAWVHSGARWDHSPSRGFTRVRLGVDGFIGVRMGSLLRCSLSPCSLEFEWGHSDAPSCRSVNCFLRGFTGARRGVAWVHWCSCGFTHGLLNVHSASLGFSRTLLKPAGFIRNSLSLLGRVRDSRVHSGWPVVTRAHLGVVGFIGDCVSSLERAY